MKLENYAGKTISSVVENGESDGHCSKLLISFTDGTTMKIEAGAHLHQIPPLTSTPAAHLVVSD
jgi:hypothetical protein